jgi:hypothetical protein
MAIEGKYGRIDVPGIPDDEPIFIFRAQDRLAEKVVRSYAGLLSLLHQDRKEMIAAVMEAADRMKQWPVKKTPD